MKTILFQGDSITEWKRNKQENASMGEGYSEYLKQHGIEEIIE